MRSSYCWALLVFLGLCFFAATTEILPFWFKFDRIYYFLDYPSLILTVASTLGFSLAATSFEACRLGLRCLVQVAELPGAEDVAQAQEFFHVFGAMSVLMGWFWTLFGLILVGYELDDLTILGVAAALCVLPLFYGIALKALAVTAERRLHYRLRKAEMVDE